MVLKKKQFGYFNDANFPKIWEKILTKNYIKDKQGATNYEERNLFTK